jgi:hypothetical protein
VRAGDEAARVTMTAVTDVMSAVFDVAVDCASEDDRLWLLAHPDRRRRLRPIVPYEFHVRMAVQPGQQAWVLVDQIKPGVRTRVPLSLPSTKEGWDALLSRLGPRPKRRAWWTAMKTSGDMVPSDPNERQIDLLLDLLKLSEPTTDMGVISIDPTKQSFAK